MLFHPLAEPAHSTGFAVGVCKRVLAMCLEHLRSARDAAAAAAARDVGDQVAAPHEGSWLRIADSKTVAQLGVQALRSMSQITIVSRIMVRRQELREGWEAAGRLQRTVRSLSRWRRGTADGREWGGGGWRYGPCRFCWRRRRAP